MTSSEPGAHTTLHCSTSTNGMNIPFTVSDHNTMTSTNKTMMCRDIYGCLGQIFMIVCDNHYMTQWQDLKNQKLDLLGIHRIVRLKKLKVTIKGWILSKILPTLNPLHNNFVWRRTCKFNVVGRLQRLRNLFSKRIPDQKFSLYLYHEFLCILEPFGL